MLPSYLFIAILVGAVLLFLIGQTALPRWLAITLRTSVLGFVALTFAFHAFSPLASRAGPVPRQSVQQSELIRFSDGGVLSRRGYYASQILAAMMASPIIRSPAILTPDMAAEQSRRAVEYADALIEALGE